MGLSTDLGAGSELLGYRIERVLGRGGMGVVYLAHQVVLDRMVALKLLAPELAEDDHFRDRFLRESRLAASLEHPAIVPIFDAGEVEGRLYISMRYVEGTDLRRLLDVEAPLAPERAVGLLGPIAGALDAAHARGLVHRDVKPANILIGEDDRPFLADFGLTREVSEGGGLEQSHFAASVDYVAPEQIARGAVGPPADVYSLGCVLFECLTGRPPFSSDSVIAALWGHVNEPPPAASERQPALPKAIDAVFARALAKDPAERYGSCRGLIDAAQHPLGLERRRPWRSARVVAAAALVAVAAVVALVVSLGRGGTPKPALHVTSNSLVRIDPATNRVAAVTPVGSRIGTATLLPGAEGVAVGADSVWVYNWDGHAVWVIDPETNDVDRTVGIAGSTPFGPSNSIAADARGAWVLSGNAGESVLTHVAPGIEFARRFAFAYDPLVVAVGRGSVWIGGKRLGSSEVVLRVDPDSGAVRAVVPLRGAAIDTEVSGVRDIQAIAGGEGAVWVLYGRTLFRIDSTKASITARLELPPGAAVALAAGGGAVWVSESRPGGPTLERIDPTTVRITGETRAPAIEAASSGAVAAHGESVWWSGRGSGVVWRVDASSGRIVSTIRLRPPAEASTQPVPAGVVATRDAVWVTVTVLP
jgi:tRNA A-37 threonylcarbamoyl transferase component Bud32